jgi:prephenate dehydratase
MRSFIVIDDHRAVNVIDDRKAVNITRFVVISAGQPQENGGNVHAF